MAKSYRDHCGVLGSTLLLTALGCSSMNSSQMGAAGKSSIGGSGASFTGDNGGMSATVLVAGGSGGSNASTAGSGPAPDACPPSWTTTPACGGAATPSTSSPDFGPNVVILDSSMSTDEIQGKLNQVNQRLDGDQFDDTGAAYFFKPGKYGSLAQNLDVRVGFYTHLVGLGKSPDDVEITGAVRSKAFLGGGNATCNFWRTAENFAVIPGKNIDGGVDVWAVSQGTSIRRAHIEGTIHLHDNGWASGGFIVDSKVDDVIDSGTQQQFFTRNVDLHQWQGGGWNMVFVGDGQAPDSSWPQPPRTVTVKTPLVREKPFLYLDDAGNYLVMVPRLKTNAQGSSWGDGTPPGSPLSLDRFYIAKPSDTASSLNNALASGKHLLLTPGDYKLDSPLQITKPNTIVLGLGLATLTPTQGNTLISIADVDGISIGGILIEAGKMKSDSLLVAGDRGASADHAQNPTFLFDVHCRIGGNIAGTAATCFTINSSDLVIDNSWLWRADHGNGADWNVNQADSGLVVNGKNVTVYGLFVEHFQKYQTMWNADGGSVYFYQSELPYDPPNQGEWMASSGHNGYPSYKVADSVTTHQAQGMGVYAFFQGDVSDVNGIETPTAAGVQMHHMMTFGGGIDHIINDMGGPSEAYSDN